jgi:hypothetical protein
VNLMHSPVALQHISFLTAFGLIHVPDGVPTRLAVKLGVPDPH